MKTILNLTEDKGKKTEVMCFIKYEKASTYRLSLIQPIETKQQAEKTVFGNVAKSGCARLHKCLFLEHHMVLHYQDAVFSPGYATQFYHGSSNKGI